MVLKNCGRGKDYKNSSIYKLVNDINDEIYVGSTTTQLCKRLSWHRQHPMPGVKAVFDEIGWEEIRIYLIESYPCTSMDELRKRERHWYNELNPSMNRKRPWISDEEKTATIALSKVRYYKRNAAAINQATAQYREQNKDQEKQRHARYRERNNDKISQRRTYNTECECGASVRHCNLAKHKRSRKHLVWQSVFDFIHN